MNEWDVEEAISDVLRIELVADEQGYNGMTPGPTIEANVGETLVVHLTNQRAQPACFCFGGCACVATPPGDSREYRFELTEAGTFRYCSCSEAGGWYGWLKVL
jgi:FtsP/CotA-like multicopper oxidase with cupredoxin domain